PARRIVNMRRPLRSALEQHPRHRREALLRGPRGIEELLPVEMIAAIASGVQWLSGSRGGLHDFPVLRSTDLAGLTASCESGFGSVEGGSLAGNDASIVSSSDASRINRSSAAVW